MKKKRKGYLEAFKEYQNRMYFPGFYTGGKIHPSLKAKTKMGGYAMTIVGSLLPCFYLIAAFNNLSLENIGWIMPVIFALLMIIVGIKFIKLDPRQ